jgi:uncharacterized protein (UPF0303 family)
MSDTAPDLEALLAEEERLVFPHFDHQTAWDLGSAMRTQALAGQLPVVISIRRNGQRLFHAALPGSAADNDAWIARKSAVVDRFGQTGTAGRRSCGASTSHRPGPLPSRI